MKSSYIKSKPTRIIAVVTIAVLCCCLIIFSGCPLPWYIPVKYSDKKMAQIYGFIKNGLLTDCDNYIATFEYSDPNDEVQRVASIFNSGGKALLSFDFYINYGETVGRAVYYDGVYKEWTAATQTEAVKHTQPEEWQFLYDKLYGYTEYLKNEVVGAEFDDGYCHQCWPFGYGMAQIYYNVNGVSTSASWAVGRRGEPLVPFAEFRSDLWKGSNAILEINAEPYDIAERAENVLKYYEQAKQL